MRASEGRGGTATRGFASMDSERKRMIASKGGFASAKANKTSNRGFASMDKNKQRMISSMGGKASKSSRQHHPEKDEKDADRNDRKREGDAFQRDLSSLEDNDDLDTSERKPDSLNYSETDEDEDEGLGDGNLGRSTRGGVGE
ncbi:MAG TPA: KGG domain-containing protein [Chryseosolibacter sp.]|nr:KGG domain-containing protein [Chryseosolibacter sp.]